MSAAKTPRASHPVGGAMVPQTRERAIRRRLEQRRLELADAIRGYPGPIAGCDQQFNWLLDQLEHVKLQLQRLDALRAQARTAEEMAEQLGSFDPESLPHEAYPHDTVHTR